MQLTQKIIIAGVIYGHVAFKTIYIRIFAGTDRMHKKDLVAVGSWIGLALSLWILAWIIASAIPVFSNLLSLVVFSSFQIVSGFYMLIFDDRVHSSLAGLALVYQVYSGYT